MLQTEHLKTDGNTLFVMGPEGGLTQDEVERLNQAGFTSLSLGKRVLRWETAALLCLGLNFWQQQLELAKSPTTGQSLSQKLKQEES